MSEFSPATPEIEISQRDEYLQVFNRLLNNYSDRIPEEIVASNSSPYYKVRKGWFMSVIGQVENAVDDDLISPEVRKRLEEMKGKYCIREFHDRMTERADIDEMNQFIDEVIADIQGS